MASLISRLRLRALLPTGLSGISGASTSFVRECSSSSSEVWPSVNTGFDANEGFGNSIASGGYQRSTSRAFQSVFPVRVMRTSPETRRESLRAINKAIVAGEVGRAPIQKVLRNGHILTLFSIGTGGIYVSSTISVNAKTNRDGLDNHLQWHKIIIHNERLGRYAMLRLRKGMKVYIEGDLETRVFNDPQTGLLKREREIAIRTTGRIMSVNENGAFEIDSILI